MNADVLGNVPSSVDTVKVLIVDDNAIDAELSIMAVRRAGIAAEGLVVAGEVQLRSALLFFVPDVILCDFSFPSFDGLEAQCIVRKAFPNAPLIFVSGSINEERATMALQAGAVDYVLKSNIDRLPDAVRRALLATAERRLLESSLDESEDRVHGQAARLAALWRVANNPDLRRGTTRARHAAPRCRGDSPRSALRRHHRTNRGR